MSNFIQRTITGFFFVLILLSAILYSKYSYAFLFFIVTILGVWEFYTLTKKDDVKPYRLLGTIIGGTLFISTFLIVSQTILPKYLILLLITSLLTFFAELFRKQKDPFKNIAFTFLGFIYVALPFSLLNLLVIDLRTGMFYRGEILMGYFFILWANDTGAYLSGRWIGKNKLFERISPKKTWEGAIGGALFSILIALICSQFYLSINLVDWIIVSIIIVITGSLGDLVESLFKRSIDVKDSGNILPGHGGILDRFDGLLLSVPFVLAYLILFSSNF